MNFRARLNAIAALLRGAADDTDFSQDKSPANAIAAAWANLEAVAWELISIKTPVIIPPPTLRFHVFAQHCLGKFNVLKPMELRAFNDLHLLLVQALNSKDAVTKQDAVDYRRLVGELTDLLSKRVRAR